MTATAAVIDSPAGCRAAGRGGYLEHTLCGLLERRFGGQGSGPAPRPVLASPAFNLPRLLGLARRSATRA